MSINETNNGGQINNNGTQVLAIKKIDKTRRLLADSD